ncbi:MAG TPA: tetratricopeptide repeat protein [Bryobacteraceae bacterium]|jgi:tetratricopeptide (TPR) repeat protein|nr:tetratricopeptide repeat protein [Bryobacteraceae bacterium]
MSRWIPLLLVASTIPLRSQQQPPPPDKPAGELQRQRGAKPAAKGKEEVPPEEDKALTTDDYSFNPLQAQKEVQTGNFYFKKGSYRAAEGRFREATKWNDGYAEAWLRLGEAEEKLKDPKAAKEAYARYLEMAPDAKNAAEIRAKLQKLK